MSEWKTYKLGEICTDISYGYTESASSEMVGPKFLRITDIQHDFINWNNVPYCPITESNHNKYKLEVGDIVIARTGASTGATAIFKDADIDAVYASYLIRYKIDKSKADPFYIGHLLKSSLWKQHVNSIIGGSGQPGANAKQFASFKIEIPDLPTQKEIASILSSLDDKIELNLQMNQTLEAMAQAIFKEWFVNFNFPGFDGELVDGLPKGWKKITLDEIAKVKNGFAFKGTDFINEGIPVIKIKNVKPNKILLNDLSYVSREVADKANKYLINQNDILITMSGNRMNGTPDTWVGKVALFQRNGEYLLNQRVSVIDLIPDYSHLKYYLTILLSSIEFQNYFISSATSSGGQANISPALIYCTEIILPDLETSKKFYLTIKSFYDKNLENELQIESLTQTRDTLLPKLMSGQLEVV
jgi:type I restriction enzyme S subunit